jgi:hypothetical protein
MKSFAHLYRPADRGRPRTHPLFVRLPSVFYSFHFLFPSRGRGRMFPVHEVFSGPSASSPNLQRLSEKAQVSFL